MKGTSKTVSFKGHKLYYYWRCHRSSLKSWIQAVNHDNLLDCSSECAALENTSSNITKR